jgi:hypothetical protein
MGQLEIMLRPLVLASFCLAAVSVSSTASAHVRFEYPTPRYPNPTGGFDNGMNIKDGPCGKANDSRATDASRITELESGATITVRYRETIGHDGFYRISFDDDGQDAFEPPPLSRDDIVTAPTDVVLKDNIPDGAGDVYETEVTLPDIECDNCTLQLIQVMVDSQTWPRSEIYYTCADITLKRTNGAGGMGGTGAGGANAGAGGATAGAGGAGSGAGGGAGSGAGGAVAGTGGVPGGSGSAGSGNTAGAGGTSAGGNAAGGTSGSTGGSSSPGTGGTTSTAGRGGGGGTPGSAGSTGGLLPSAGSSSSPSAPEDEGGCSITGVQAPRTSGAVVAVLGGALLAFAARRKRR